MDDKLGSKIDAFPLFNGYGLVFSMVIFGMGLIGGTYPGNLWCLGITTVVSLAMACISLKHIFVVVHEKGLHIRSLVGKRIVLWTDITEIQTDIRTPPHFEEKDQGGSVFFTVLAVWMDRFAGLVMILLEILALYSFSKYTFTLHNGQIIKFQGDRYLANLDGIIWHLVAPRLSCNLIGFSTRFFRHKMRYRLSNNVREGYTWVTKL